MKKLSFSIVHLVAILFFVGCSWIKKPLPLVCPEGSLPIRGENIDAVCEGKIGLRVLDQSGNIAGNCNSSGPVVSMCVKTEWCIDGTQKITPNEIICERGARAESKKYEIKIAAKDCNPCLNVKPSVYGPEIILNHPTTGHRPNGATYVFDAVKGEYQLYVEYAAKDPRPVSITLNKELYKRVALKDTTGSWGGTNSFHIGNVHLNDGVNRIVFYRDDVFPHLKSIKFVPLN